VPIDEFGPTDEPGSPEATIEEPIEFAEVDEPEVTKVA
jgi:hypothetical protein